MKKVHKQVKIKRYGSKVKDPKRNKARLHTTSVELKFTVYIIGNLTGKIMIKIDFTH